LRKKVQILVQHNDPLGFIWTKLTTSQQYTPEKALKRSKTLSEPTTLYADKMWQANAANNKLDILLSWVRSFESGEARIRNSVRSVELPHKQDAEFWEGFRGKYEPLV